MAALEIPAYRNSWSEKFANLKTSRAYSETQSSHIIRVPKYTLHMHTQYIEVVVLATKAEQY